MIVIRFRIRVQVRHLVVRGTVMFRNLHRVKECLHKSRRTRLSTCECQWVKHGDVFTYTVNPYVGLDAQIHTVLWEFPLHSTNKSHKLS